MRTPAGPLGVGSGSAAQGFAPCGVNPSGVPWVSAALANFFRPSGMNASIANALIGAGAGQCVGEVPLVMQYLQASGYSTTGFNTACNPLTGSVTGCIPFGDMDANYSNGSSVYHGLTANLRKRFSSHYEFLASYTWSHAIDDSTDLQSTLTPQDSYFPGLDRSNSTFDQRHRFVFSGVYQSGKLSGSGFASKLFSNWTFAPQIEFGSGRPFNMHHRQRRQPAVVLSDRAAQHLRNTGMHRGWKPGNTVEILTHRYFPGALLSSFHSHFFLTRHFSPRHLARTRRQPRPQCWHHAVDCL